MSDGPQRPDRPQNRKWRIAKRILLGFGMLCVLSTLAVIGVEQYLLRVTKAAVANVSPPGPLPSPNAFDDYVAATEALVETEKLDAAFPSRRQARPASTGLSLEEKEAVIRKNAAALKHIREGFTHEYHEPQPLPSYYQVGRFFPQIAGFRRLMRLLLLEGQVREGRGNPAGAMNSYLDAIRLGRDISDDGMYSSFTTGSSIEAMGRKYALPLVEKLSASEARQAARRMERLTGGPDRFLTLLKREREWKRTMVHAALYPEAWEETFEYQGPPPPLPSEGEDVMEEEGSEFKELTGTVPAFMNLQQVRADDAYINAYVANSHRPLFSQNPKDYTLSGYVAANFLKIFAELYSKGWVRERTSEARNRMLMTALALHAYRQEHGHYPAALSDLAPDYLKAVPADPFAPKSTLRYRPAGDSYRLYSVGPDTKDDGGEPIKEPKRSERAEDDQEPAPYTPPPGDVVAMSVT